MTTIGHRLGQVRAELKLSQTIMAQQLGIAQSTLSLLEKGQSGLNSELLAGLLEHYHISADWMITGEGPQYIKASDRDTGIPMVKVDARAGYLDHEGSTAYLETLERYRLPNFEGAKGYRIFGVEGDSMIPTFFPGDNVVCQPLDQWKSIHEDTLAVVVSVDEIVIKRVSYFDSADGAIILRSDNPSYKPQMLELHEVREIWSVSARITTTLDHAVLLTNQKVGKLESDLGEVREQLTELRRLIKMLRFDHMDDEHGGVVKADETSE